MTLCTEPKPGLGDTCPWSEKLSNELLYEDVVQLSKEEQGDKIDISEQPATLCKSSKCKQIIKALNMETILYIN